MEEAAAADRILILDHGEIIASGPPFALKERYAKDKLRLYHEPGVVIPGTPTPYGTEVTLNATMEALPIVNKFCSQIRGFEVIQGTMDDVFLNALSRQEVAQ